LSQSRNPRRSGNPSVRAGATAATPARAGLEKRSRTLLIRLAAVPRLLILLVALGWLLAGLFLPGPVGGALLLLLAGALTWLVALSWPVLTAAQRVLRSITVGIVVAYAVARLLH
jgi:hypothetical protein